MGTLKYVFRQPKLYRQHYKSFRQGRRNRVILSQRKEPFFSNELMLLLGCDETWLTETLFEYTACPAAWEKLSGLRSVSRETDGFAKSLDVAEGFALWALVKWIRPQVVVELGVQYGISARLWLEALKRYVPRHELILCDLEDKRLFIDDRDCTFLQGDAYQLLPEIFETRSVDLLHNDAHPYSLIHWSVGESIKLAVKALTFHDISSTPPRNPFKLVGAELSPEEKRLNDNNWGKYGTWERHVMGEYFGEKILYEAFTENDDFRVQAFESSLGFAVALRKDQNGSFSPR